MLVIWHKEYSLLYTIGIVKVKTMPHDSLFDLEKMRAFYGECQGRTKK